MEVYLENIGLYKILYYVNLLEKKTGDNCFGLHLISSSKNVIGAIKILRHKSNIGLLEIVMPINLLNKSLIKKINDEVFNITIIVNYRLTARQIRLLYKIKKIVKVIDKTVFNNEEFYKKNRYILLVNGHNLKIADIYNLNCGVLPKYQCNYSSCLGKVIYIKKNGDISFCPKYVEQTKMGNIKDNGEIFSGFAFKNILEKSVKRRQQCLKFCKYFEMCRGGVCLTKIVVFLKEITKKRITKLRKF